METTGHACADQKQQPVPIVTSNLKMKYELTFYRHLASMTFRCLGFFSFSLHNYEKPVSSLKLKGFCSDSQELSKREITDKIIAKQILEIQKSDLLDYMWYIMYLSN